MKDGKEILPGTAVIEKGGVKVGFLGLETPETYTKVNPALIKGLSFAQKEDLYQTASAIVKDVKARGADIVVGLFHLGVDEESIGNRSVDVYNNVEGLDIILDGHSHTVMTPGDDGEFSALPIQSTGTKFANVGVVVIDPAEKKIVECKLVPAEELAVADDNPILLKAKAIKEAVDAEYGAVFAKSEVELNGDRAPGNRNMETNLGDLITDAMLWSVLKEGNLKVDADHVVAITNGGGIRAWIHAGDVTMKDINTVLPFGNTVAVIYVSGAELLEALEASTYSTPTAIGGFPQVSGLKYSINTDKEFDQGDQYPASTYYAPKSIQRVTIENVNGQDFDPEATYAVVTNNFCAAGGDTYYAFKAASDQFDTSIPMDEALMDYVDEVLGGVIGAQYARPMGRILIGSPDEIALLRQINDLYGALPADEALTEACAKAINDAMAAADKAEDAAGLKAALDDLVKAAKALEFKPNTFKDVKDGDWFKPAVDFAQSMGLMDGVGYEMFAPKNYMTRAMVVTVLYRFAGSPDVTGLECPFTDLTQDWYKNAVVWASYMNITTGKTDKGFFPDDPVTREQMATFISRFLFVQGEEDLTEELRNLLATTYYSDAAAIDDYAVQHVANCTVHSIMLGDKAAEGQKLTTFRPLDTMNRAECAQVLLNMYKELVNFVLPLEGTDNSAPLSFRPAA